MSRRDRRSSDRGEPGERLPENVVADLVDSDRRRHVLACLSDAEEPTPVADLSRRVAARERGVPPDDVDETDVDAVRDEVYHVHLPKLTATGVVSFDSLVGTVDLATDDERLRDPADPT